MSSMTVIAPPKENTPTQEISLDGIQPSAANPRGSIDSAALAELITSIKTHGVLQPIIGRPVADGAFEIVCGERRFRAARGAGKLTISRPRCESHRQ